MFLVVLGFTACATQDAHKAYFKAQERLRLLSEKLDPRDPTLTKAYDALTAGRAQMLDARYDLALRNFNQALLLSDQAESDAVRAKHFAEQPGAIQSGIVVTNEIGEVDNGSPEVIIAANEIALPPALSPEAVATYLATNSLEPHEDTAQGLDVAIESLTPKKKAPVKKIAPKPAAKTPMPAKESIATSKEVETGDGVVVAPITPSLKAPPGISDNMKDDSKVVSVTEEKAEKSEVPAGKRRRIPGVLGFVVGDSSLLQETMDSLNQNAKFLLENPSVTMIFQGTYSGDEPRGIVDSRFESIKSYLTGKGVPEDQIKMDEERKRGPSEFKLFVIEH